METVPHFSLNITEDISDNGIVTAYEKLSNCYNGVRDFITVLSSIEEGVFNLEEVTIAGLLLSEALNGKIIHRTEEFKAKYLRINNEDCIFLVDMKVLSSGFYQENSTFYAEDGTEYEILSQKKR